MGPYSHYVLATKLAPILKPEDLGAYYWGAVAPDIRYLARLPREQTHLPPEQLKNLQLRYPGLRSFILGYQTHIQIDQFDVFQAVKSTFPFNRIKLLLRKSISRQQIYVLVEMYFLKSSRALGRLYAEQNEVLDGLGIDREEITNYVEILQEYFDQRSMDAALAAFQKMGMVDNLRLDSYLKAYRSMPRQRLLISLFMLSIRYTRLESRVVAYVQENLVQSRVDQKGV